MLRARLGRLGRGGLPLGRAQPPPPLLRRDALLRARALSSATAVGDDAGVAEDHALKLRQEIKVLGWALGDTLRSGPNNGEESYDAVERMRSLAKDWRELSTSSFGATHGAEANVKLQLAVLYDVDPSRIELSASGGSLSLTRTILSIAFAWPSGETWCLLTLAHVTRVTVAPSVHSMPTSSIFVRPRFFLTIASNSITTARDESSTSFVEGRQSECSTAFQL